MMIEPSNADWGDTPDSVREYAEELQQQLQDEMQRTVLLSKRVCYWMNEAERLRGLVEESNSEVSNICYMNRSTGHCSGSGEYQCPECPLDYRINLDPQNDELDSSDGGYEQQPDGSVHFEEYRQPDSSDDTRITTMAELENRYIVLKRSDVAQLSELDQVHLNMLCNRVKGVRADAGKPIDKRYVVSEDWSMYAEPVKKVLAFADSKNGMSKAEFDRLYLNEFSFPAEPDSEDQV